MTCKIQGTTSTVQTMNGKGKTTPYNKSSTVGIIFHGITELITKWYKEVQIQVILNFYLGNITQVTTMATASALGEQEVTEPLNNGKIRYYSVMNDGSSSAKTLNEKELFLIKTASDGIPKFSMMSLEEPEDANAEIGVVRQTCRA